MPSMAWPMTTATVESQAQDTEISSPPPPVAQNPDSSLHLPRILCLHGGGTNARIFRTQCRVLRVWLAPYFRLVFADGPFFSRPGPDVESVYAEWGPFRSWIQPEFSHGSVGFRFEFLDNEAHVASIDRSIAAAMQEDDKLGATGKWIGLLGFSQGAKMAASLLLRQQNQEESKADRGRRSRTRDIDYRFAVLLAGRAPLISMDIDMYSPFAAGLADSGILGLPTIHVHGLRDAGIAMHRDLLHKCCEKGSTRLVEWDGDHRVPIKTKDVAPLVAEILAVAAEVGVLGH